MSETTKKADALRLVTLNSDESSVDHPTRRVALLHPDTTRYLTGVEAVVRILSPAELKALEDKHRHAEKTPRGVDWKVNQEHLVHEMLVTAVESWTGVLGADGKPIRLCPAALKALDALNQAHLAAVAKTPAEVVDPEVVDASFREPAGVGRVGQ